MAGIQVVRHILLSTFENNTTQQYNTRTNTRQHIMAAPTMQQPELDTTSIPGYVIFPELDDKTPQATTGLRSQVHPLGK